ncbi:LuxR C-terminal-related transcriptional regulator [Shewanella xiamenensis]|uniref:LuxR C-terminal-related transcriptional regulator n=1 Tax=Shewanella xiamenensis TaxID=332186 RepID=UPI003D156D8C
MPHTKDLITYFKQTPPKSVLDILEKLFPELSSKEVEALYWFAFGLHTTDVSTLMRANSNTVKTYVNRCKVKLNTESSTDLRLIFHSRFNSFTLASTFNYQFSTTSN